RRRRLGDHAGRVHRRPARAGLRRAGRRRGPRARACRAVGGRPAGLARGAVHPRTGRRCEQRWGGWWGRTGLRAGAAGGPRCAGRRPWTGTVGPEGRERVRGGSAMSHPTVGGPTAPAPTGQVTATTPVAPVAPAGPDVGGAAAAPAAVVPERRSVVGESPATTL